ncbi:hypothetical protein KY285_009096 [Solanum tuberosum]|nr:hypothetical protein KY285_009096 [Solanum tuberosum]
MMFLIHRLILQLSTNLLLCLQRQLHQLQQDRPLFRFTLGGGRLMIHMLHQLLRHQILLQVILQKILTFLLLFAKWKESSGYSQSKLIQNGSVARLKAILVAKEYAQTYGVDYSDTFSPVAKLTFVRLFISLAASENWPLHQLDIKNVFLHSDLHEEVYMEQLHGFVAQGEYGKVCHLKKSLYGLKQSPRFWFGKFSEVVQEFGLEKSKM